MPADLELALPIVPLREMVVLPHSVTSLSIGRPRSIAAVEAALLADRRLLLVAQRQPNQEVPALEDLHGIGVVADILQTFRQPDGSLRVLLEGKQRARVVSLTQIGEHLHAECLLQSPAPPDDPDLDGLVRLIRSQIGRISKLDRKLPPEAVLSLDTVSEAGHLADLAACYLLHSPADRQILLEILSVPQRLEALAGLLAKSLDALELDHEIHQRVRTKIDQVQRDFYLKEKLRAIQDELGELDEKSQEITAYRAALKKAKLPKDAAERVEREISRLHRMGLMSSESGSIRSYLDTVLALPWSKRSRERLDLLDAQATLDARHFGLEKVKERILEFLAVRALSKTPPTTVLCLVGPPGVGKTSLVRSIAKTLHREFVRISLGGVHDEAEIRGHRRTYIGAMPGRILTGLRTAGSKNPVFLLDEIDKIGQDVRGNPAAALLEVLDPEQNKAFSDHYVELPFDLSEVLFIVTANSIAGIPPALKDRFEILRLGGYTELEKIEIAQRHLIPKAIASHGLKSKQFSLDTDVLETIIRGWTLEAGVRQLERRIAALCRKTARLVVEKKALAMPGVDALEALLGPASQRIVLPQRHPEIGTAYGMAWSETGGSLISVEVASLKGRGQLILTGQLGEVMRESAQAAYTFVKGHAESLGIMDGAWKRVDLHLHVPQGAIPKDGPSAGMAIACAIASVLSGRPVRSDVAMTGEITLRGRVLPIGGVREKTLAAYRHEISTVLLPFDNQSDLNELPAPVKSAMDFKLIERLEEALEIVLLPPVASVSPLPEFASRAKA